MKKEINLLKSQIREQQEVTLKSKIEVLKITEDKEKLKNEFEVPNTIQIADHNKLATNMNHLENQTETLANSSNVISTEKKVTTHTQDFKTVSATEFLKRCWRSSTKEIA